MKAFKFGPVALSVLMVLQSSCSLFKPEQTENTVPVETKTEHVVSATPAALAAETDQLL